MDGEVRTTSVREDLHAVSENIEPCFAEVENWLARNTNLSPEERGEREEKFRYLRREWTIFAKWESKLKP